MSYLRARKANERCCCTKIRPFIGILRKEMAAAAATAQFVHQNEQLSGVKDLFQILDSSVLVVLFLGKLRFGFSQCQQRSLGP